MQSPKLVQIKTEDGLTLPGLLYEAMRNKRVAIHLHGNGSTSVFYSDDQRDQLAEALDQKGISFLMFNNRGADYVRKLEVIRGKKIGAKRFGMAYEKIKDCVKDIDGAIDYLGKLGYQQFYLIGESTGANKICVYHHYKLKNKVLKYVLLGGCDDTGSYYDLLGREKFFELLKESKQKIERRKGNNLIVELLPGTIFSYVGFYDIANPDGDYNVFPFLEVIKNLKLSKKPLFRYFKSISKPTLVVYGGNDKYAWGDVSRVVNILKERKPELEYKIIKDADHSFSNKQKDLSNIISSWLLLT